MTKATLQLKRLTENQYEIQAITAPAQRKLANHIPIGSTYPVTVEL